MPFDSIGTFVEIESQTGKPFRSARKLYLSSLERLFGQTVHAYDDHAELDSFDKNLLLDPLRPVAFQETRAIEKPE